MYLMYFYHTCHRYVGTDMFFSTAAISDPGTAASNNNGGALANVMQQMGAKAYVAVNISMPITKTAFLARTTDFIVSFKHTILNPPLQTQAMSLLVIVDC
jgi:hypothetical protein